MQHAAQAVIRRLIRQGARLSPNTRKPKGAMASKSIQSSAFWRISLTLLMSLSAAKASSNPTGGAVISGIPEGVNDERPVVKARLILNF